MSVDILSTRSTRRIANSTGLEIVRAWGHGDYQMRFVTPDHRHGWWDKKTGQWGWTEDPIHYTFRMRGWDGRGSTTAWRKVRAQVLARDGHQCQLRLDGVCTYRATHVPHLHGKDLGDHPSGLVASCAACNLHLGSVTTQDPAPAPRTKW